MTIIRNILSLLPQLVQQGAAELEKRREKSKLRDLLEAQHLSEQAKNSHVEFLSLLRKNKFSLEKKRLRRHVRKKVQKVIATQYNHKEIVDEVTERLVDAASHDPFYQRWFG